MNTNPFGPALRQHARRLRRLARALDELLAGADFDLLATEAARVLLRLDRVCHAVEALADHLAGAERPGPPPAA